MNFESSCLPNFNIIGKVQGLFSKICASLAIISGIWNCTRSDEDVALYHLDDAFFLGVAVVSAEPSPATIDLGEQVVVEGEPEMLHQILSSEDLRRWSPNYRMPSVVAGEDGPLGWLVPKRSTMGGPLVWQVDAASRQGYFTAWRYELPLPFDADADGLPDYWERRYFRDLRATPEGDSDMDGTTHLEEAQMLMGPGIQDTDGDGLPDEEELAYEPSLDPLDSDTDGDGLGDGDEVRIHLTDPHVTDSDADGFDDAFEVRYLSDPNLKQSVPDSGTVLASYSTDLMVYFDFESVQDTSVQNHGVLGGAATIIGEQAHFVDGGENPTSSTALELRNPPDVVDSSYLATNLTLEDLGLADTRQDLTIALWLRADRIDGAALISTGRNSLSLHLEDDQETPNLGGIRMIQQGDWSEVSLVEGSTIPLGVWRHVAWTSRDSVWSLYIDGKLQAEQRQSLFIVDSGPHLAVGGRLLQQRLEKGFTGAMDELRIYRRALSAGDIALMARR